MYDHSLGLGVSPGWTKTQATEPADHKPFNRLNPERCFLPHISLHRARSGNKKPSNTKSYVFCHRLVNKDLLGIVNQMPQPETVTATYTTGTSRHSTLRQTRHTTTSSTRPPLPTKNMAQTNYSTTTGDKE